jgi:hypothetical protein
MSHANAVRQQTGLFLQEDSHRNWELALSLSDPPIIPLALLLGQFLLFLLYLSPVIGESTGSRDFLIDLPFSASAAIHFIPSILGLFKVVYADTTE